MCEIVIDRYDSASELDSVFWRTSLDPVDLLTTLARDLQAEAHRFVPVAMTKGAEFVPHPMGWLVAIQQAPSVERFHLPEPILHPVADPDVLAVGLNPGCNAAEAMPDLTSTLEEYVAWYATRFDTLGRTRTGLPASTRDTNSDKGGRSHYASVERILIEAGLGERPLGRNASYADAIPWKGKVAPNLREPALAALAQARLRRIIEGLRPQVVLALSPEVGALLGAVHPRQPKATPLRLGEWHGHVVATYHPNHRFRGPGSGLAHRTATAGAIASVLGG